MARRNPLIARRNKGASPQNRKKQSRALSLDHNIVQYRNTNTPFKMHQQKMYT